MGRPKIDEKPMATTSPRSQTLPSSPTHSTLSSSSSEFEFMTLSLSPRTKSSSSSAAATADDLFYKGQLLPLHLSPRLSMVRSLLLSSSSTSSSSTTTTTTTRPSTSSSRPSSASDSTSTSSSARPSSATTIDDDELKRLNTTHHHHHNQIKKPNKYSSLSKKLSSVFRVKEHKVRDPENNNLPAGSSVKRAKEVLRKYLKKVKPLYEKLSSSSSSQKQKITTNYSGNLYSLSSTVRSVKEREKEKESYTESSLSHSFSGNLMYPRKKALVSSCPSSMRSSPNHSGILYRNGLPMTANIVRDSSSMEELQSAIQGAIAHCKKSMVENKSMVSNEV